MVYNKKNIMIIPKYLIIHHTASPQNFTFEQINNIGIDRGFGGISYNYLIDASGKTFIGRSLGEIPAQCKADGMNFKSLGIALVGDFTQVKPTDSQLQSLEQQIIKLMAQYNIPKENVLGHCEVKGSATQCPGCLKNWIVSFRGEDLRSKIINLLKILLKK